MLNFNVNNFKQQLKGEGARNTLFDISINWPGGELPNIEFLCKAASLPASTIGMIEVPYFGRKIKVAGDRTFADWTTTIINLEDFLLRDELVAWMNGINSHVGNVKTDASYKDAVATVNQYAKDGSFVKQYVMVNIWPSEIAAIDVDWNSTDTIEDFTVTWHYDYWTSNDTDDQ